MLPLHRLSYWSILILLRGVFASVRLNVTNIVMWTEHWYATADMRQRFQSVASVWEVKGEKSSDQSGQRIRFGY